MKFQYRVIYWISFFNYWISFFNSLWWNTYIWLIQTFYSETPLHLAVLYENIEIIKLLLEQKSIMINEKDQVSLIIILK